MLPTTARSYLLKTETGAHLGQVVLTEDGMFAAVTEFGNVAFAWMDFGGFDFREFIIGMSIDYFGGKIYQAEAEAVPTKNGERDCQMFATKILPPLQAVLKTELLNEEKLNKNMITIQKHHGVNVLRDDLLPGGTKSILMPSIIGEAPEYVYATPVYGGFQIALAAYCYGAGKKATIFCAKRKVMHENTLKCLAYGANVIEVPHGYLSVVEKRAKDYCGATGAVKIVFGGKTEENKKIIAGRVANVITALGKEPEEIWCAIGSGTLAESILEATKTAVVYGVQVGAEYMGAHHERLRVLTYPLGFDKPSKFKVNFPSTPNYDLKAIELCVKNKKSKNVLFWNVL